MSKNVFVLGLGHIGAPLALKLSQLGYRVSGTTRSPQKFSKDFQSRVTVAPFQLGSELPVDLGNFDIVISTLTPFDEMADFYLEIFQKLPKKTRIFFFSSTSVFSTDQNEVDENSLALETSARGKRLRNCEEILSHNHSRLCILRPGGLISETRHPARTLAYKKDLLDGESFVNLVQESDVVEALILIIEEGFFAPIVHIVSPEHPRKKEYYQKSAQKLGLPLPEYKREKPATEKNCNTKIVHSKRLLEWGFKFRSLDDF